MTLSRECDPRHLPGSKKTTNGRDQLLHENTGNHRGEDAPCKIILFVDDEPSILEVRRFIFEDKGYLALTAESGEEALEILQANAVDVVVLDYLMPGMDGEETARRIRRLKSGIPIILSSGCLSIPQRVLENFDASVDKLASPEALLRAVEEQIRTAPV